MATNRSIQLVVCAALIALGCVTALERSPLHSLLSDKERVLFRVTRTQHDHVHEGEEEEGDGHGHEEEGAGQGCLTECAIAHEFAELAEELKFGNSRFTCDIEPEHCHHDNETEHGHDDDHHDDDHHGNETEHGHDDHHDDDHHDDDHHGNETEEEHDHHEAGSGVELCSGYPTCLQTYRFFLQLMKRLNLTSDCCLVNGTRCGEGGTEGGRRTGLTDPAKAYGYGFLMAIAVASASVFGVLVVPLVQKNSKFGRFYKYFKTLMIALGVSALFCDAILHLIPHAFNLHAHDEEEGEAHSHEEEGIADYIWKGVIVILGVYMFFLLEVVLHIWDAHTHGRTHVHGLTLLSDDESISSDSDSSDTRMKKGKHCETVHLDVTMPGVEVVVSQETPIDASELTNRADGDVIANKETGGEPVMNNKEKEVEGKENSDKKAGCLRRVYYFFANIKPLAWLIILGDSVHKLADGLALGAAVSQSLSLGLSTAIAVLFHEVPHEFGDFVILLSTGMKWYIALLFNVVSSLAAILGFFVGVAIGTQSTETTNWILAIAAGVFLYIALVDLLPELIHSREKGRTRWMLFLMANIGFYISFVVLLLIAIYEEELNTLIQ